jgi:hypothetical protein
MTKRRMSKNTVCEHNKLHDNPNTCSEHQHQTHPENKLERRRRIEELNEERRMRHELELF